jgi:predicted short-subunit dehydrogenase-like oxidoreductase (DUF2520 family)
VNDRPRIAIIGPGKVGTALGMLAAKAGWPVAAVGGRDASRTAEAAGLIGPATRACSLVEAAGAGELVLLTVSDDAIEPVCSQLAQAGALARGAIVAHCCGALGSDALLAAAAVSPRPLGSMHPLQTFPSVQAALERIPGTYFFCEGDAAATAVLERLAAEIGGRPVRIEAAAKPLYHAAAVVASNYLVVLMDSALAIASAAGIQREIAKAALAPLVRATLDNVLRMGPEAALTGPISRGDVTTIRRHVEALAKAPGHQTMLYAALGGAAAELAARTGRISPDDAMAIWRELMQVHARPRGGK